MSDPQDKLRQARDNLFFTIGLLSGLGVVCSLAWVLYVVGQIGV